MPSSYTGAEPICISGVTGGSQQLTALEDKVSLTGNEWQKHTIVTGPEAPCILGIDSLRRGYFKDPKGYRVSEDPSIVGLLRVEEQQVLIATTTVHQRQYHTDQDSLIAIHKLIYRLESQGVISKTRSPFNSPIWPVQKSNGEWRLTVDYHGLNEVTPPLSATVPDMLELPCELESKAAKWLDLSCGQNWSGSGSFSQPRHLTGCGPRLVTKGSRLSCSPAKASGVNGPTWSLWQKAPGETRGRPPGFWSRGYRGSEARYSLAEKEILAAHEGVRAASEVVGTEAQLFLAPRLLVLGWMFKGRVLSTHHAADATWKVKAIQLALDIAEREKWPVLYLYTDSWMVGNALWGWFQQWKESNWQRRGKPIWAAAVWQDIAAWVENLVVKVRHVDIHVPRSQATEEHQNNQQVDQATEIEVAQVDLDWQHKGELFIAWWAHDASGHQGRDATYRRAHD
ncbi:hypothetical protein QYF61_027193 [Mycteria americana]|uniref:RNase H type-1 domain-containing protein n=1 Tax=Mycteria americana TaxID=33587 RepID=A0AAN7N3N7_MYCAM|nr:hypothetical protein QYF61_027193 [Mycteria americana]